MKAISTIIISLSILSAFMLSLTASEQLQSLSAYDLTNGVIWYKLMHGLAIIFLASNHDKNKYNLAIAIGMLLILSFDMHHYLVIHNTVTALTLILAIFSLVSVITGFRLMQMIFIGACSITVFCIGYFNHASWFWLTEILAMMFIMNGKLIEVYK